MQLLDTIPAYNLQAGDILIYKGRTLEVKEVDDQTDKVIVLFEDDTDNADEPFDPFDWVEIWGY